MSTIPWKLANLRSTGCHFGCFWLPFGCIWGWLGEYEFGVNFQGDSEVWLAGSRILRPWSGKVKCLSPGVGATNFMATRHHQPTTWYLTVRWPTRTTCQQTARWPTRLEATCHCQQPKILLSATRSSTAWWPQGAGGLKCTYHAFCIVFGAEMCSPGWKNKNVYSEREVSSKVTTRSEICQDTLGL